MKLQLLYFILKTNLNYSIYAMLLSYLWLGNYSNSYHTNINKSNYDSIMWKTNNSSCSCSSKNIKVPSRKTSQVHNISVRKVVPSKKINNGDSVKSCSTGVVAPRRYPLKTKKTTKSEATVPTQCQYKILDFCKNCGDAVESKPKENKEIINKLVSDMNVRSVRNDNIVNQKKKTPIKQYYKNENFLLSTESMHLYEGNPKLTKNSLHTIKELSELHTTSDDSICLIYSDSEDDTSHLDLDDSKSIEKLKEFRNQNYFECHSTKSRIKTRPSVTSLNNHKCVYRFYLNDRLFPVPLNTDYNNKVRCVECHLPMEIKRHSKDGGINGTIQAKVKLGKETQDMVLLLPVKESLIIEERRKAEKMIDDNFVYFGVIKLSAGGNSIYNRTLPQDSLALKYQKGYKETQFDARYQYKNIDDNDIIVI